MNIPDMFTFDPEGDPNHWLVESLGVALTSPKADQATHEQNRPTLVLTMLTADRRCCQRHEQRAIMGLCTWQTMAELEGQLRAARESTSVDRQDQWQALCDEIYTASLERARGGRPRG